MKKYLLLALSAAVIVAVAGCADMGSPSSGGSIAPSGSSTGSIGASH